MVKTISSGLQSDLDGAVTTHCMCWRIARVDTTVMGFTDHDNDLEFDSLTFKASTGINASTLQQSTDLNVDDMETIGAISSDSVTEQDIRLGKYDNAEVEVYLVDYTNVAKRMTLFKGNLGNVVRSRTQFRAEVRSLAHSLNQTQGRVYQKTCSVDLFSPKCGILESAPNMKITPVAVASVLSSRVVVITNATLIARPTNWFTGGKLLWLTGNNAGKEVEVKSHLLQDGDTEAWLDLWEAMPFTIQAGDTFTIWAGCDKSAATCQSKFGNIINFRGFPRQPGQDAIVQFASRRDVNDGSSWYE